MRWPVGTGWWPILDKAAEEIPIKPHEVKEKYGTLSIQPLGGLYEEEWDRLQFYEEMSAFVCEECGTTAEVTTTGGWLKTLCKECHENVNIRED